MSKVHRQVCIILIVHQERTLKVVDFFLFWKVLGGVLTVCQLLGSLANIRSLIFLGGGVWVDDGNAALATTHSVLFTT